MTNEVTETCTQKGNEYILKYTLNFPILKMTLFQNIVVLFITGYALANEQLSSHQITLEISRLGQQKQIFSLESTELL